MLTKTEKAEYRGRLFRHLDGLVTTPTAHVLWRKGIPQYLEEHGEARLDYLAEHFTANEGYLNVALRILCSQGWLEQEIDHKADTITFRTNKRSAAAFQLFPLYQEASELLRFSGNFHPRKFEIAPFRKMLHLFEDFKNRFGLGEADGDEEVLQEQILAHIEGILLGPTTVHLGMNGMFHKYFMEASFTPEEFHGDSENFSKLLEMLSWFGYFDQKDKTFSFTAKGLFFARRAAAYGVTVSYMPTLRNLEELIFGDPAILRDVPPGQPELHVDRAMNVWGSGGAHAGYFKVIDEIVINLFNRPIEQQPRGILDMGCGNGAFLIHLFDVIEKQTLRGTMLEEYPLFLVGADYNLEALEISRQNLIAADVWAKLLWGDIGNPDKLAGDLKSAYSIDLGELLNVRTFLDHNRVWEEGAAQVHKSSDSTGAFAHRGKRISNMRVEDNLLAHFKKWKPYVERFGLLTIELHTVPPQHVAANIGRSPATAYDATHGYSDQYIVEVEVFNRLAAEAGLEPDPAYFRKYPDSELATVSINLLRGNS